VTMTEWAIFLIFAGLVIRYLSKPMPEIVCRPHEWIYKPVDDKDPAGDAYLVCNKCRKLPGGLPEEFYIRSTDE